MLLSIAWIVFACECVVAVVFGFIFWHAWSHAAITQRVRMRAIGAYAIGCILILFLSLAMPL